MEKRMSNRLVYFLGLVAVITILGTSFYLQFFDGFNPCPLCTLQRISFGVIGILLLLGIFLHRKNVPNIILSFLTLVFSVIGFLLAARQTWLQHFPPLDNTECGVSLQYMMQVLPISEVAQKILTGSAECTQRGWEFLYLSMSEWAVIWFAVFFCASAYIFIREFKKKK